ADEVTPFFIAVIARSRNKDKRGMVSLFSCAIVHLASRKCAQNEAASYRSLTPLSKPRDRSGFRLRALTPTRESPRVSGTPAPASFTPAKRLKLTKSRDERSKGLFPQNLSKSEEQIIEELFTSDSVQ